MTSGSSSLTVFTLGETLALMHSAKQGPLAYAAQLDVASGGAESNLAIAMTRLGIDVTWLGRIGADSLGDRVLADIRGEGVMPIVIRDSRAPTALMIKERRTGSHTRVWYYRSGSAGSRLRAEDIPAGVVEDASLVHLSGITPALSASAEAAFFAVIDRARAANVPISLDLNYRAQLWSAERAAAVYRRAIPLVDLVFGGDDEVTMAMGSGEPIELARRLVEAGASEGIVKLGADGCVAWIEGRAHEQPAVPVNVVDTVGAGDSFVAGYLTEWLLRRPADERLRTAVSCGALACMVAGDWEGMPTRDELSLLGAREPVTR